MTKEFCTYEQAMALKELDFDEPCFGTYLSSLQSDWKVYELILEMGMNEEFEDNRNVYLLEGACSAPLYQQAFRFFREKHNLVFNFISYNIVKPGEYHWSITWNDEAKASGIVKTYEEAELECLNTLIKIVKSKT